MSLLSEADVVAFRREHYELLSRLLAGEPDAELLGALRESIQDRAIGAAQVHRMMGEGWRLMGEYLETDSHEDVVTEFTRIFLGPFGDMLNPYESYYFTKSLYSHPLADVRGFLARQSLEPVETERKEPEDVLAFELAIMAQLIARQQAAGDADPATLIEPQREFLSQHLLIWGPACAADIEANPNGRFYKGVGQLLLGFFEVERDFFNEDGGMEVESLEQARKRYHATGYRGPIYDPEQLMAGKAPKEGKDK